MGTLTLQQMIGELKAHLGNRIELTDPRYVIALNVAQTRIARLRDWDELERLSAGVLTVGSKLLGQPTDTHKIFTFRLVHATNTVIPRKLTYVPSRQWDTRIPAPQALSAGIPEIYTIWGNQFELWRVPDLAYDYELRHTVWPTDFSVSLLTGVSSFNKKDDMVLALATSWLYLGLREDQLANTWWTVYRELAASAGVLEELQPDQQLSAYQRGVAGVTDYWTDPFVDRNP